MIAGICVAIVLISSVVAPQPAKEEVSPMKILIPAEVNGWKAVGADGVYDRKNLFDYIDGGAEVYLAYGFRQALTRRFEKRGQPAIVVDVFDMGSSEDAYGIFSFERESACVGIGQDSEYAAGLLRFWKGRFFICVLAERETSAAKRAVMALGKLIAQGIKSPGARPVILAMLPTRNLIATSVRYFHKKSGLDYHYFLADKNILELGERTEALLAEYRTGTTKTRLLLVRYPDPEKASAAFDGFVAAYMPEARGTGIVRTEDGKWTAAKREGPLVVATFGAPTKAQAEILDRAVNVKSR